MNLSEEMLCTDINSAKRKRGRWASERKMLDGWMVGKKRPRKGITRYLITSQHLCSRYFQARKSICLSRWVCAALNKLYIPSPYPAPCDAIKKGVIVRNKGLSSSWGLVSSA